jgi:ADP-ribose pyrophosphatase YjhB (NUDIX family)
MKRCCAFQAKIGQKQSSRPRVLNHLVRAPQKRLLDRDAESLRHLSRLTSNSRSKWDFESSQEAPHRRGFLALLLLRGCLLPSDQVQAVAGDKTEAIEWCDPERPGHRLTFDHSQLLARALTTLQDKVERGALPLHLLPAKFTLTDLQRACEAILGRELDKGAFRRKIADQPTLVLVPGEYVRGPQRPAQLYRAAADFSF